MSDDHDVHDADSILRTIAEHDSDVLTSVVKDSLFQSSFLLTRDQLVQKLALHQGYENSRDVDFIQKADEYIGQFWKSASNNLQSANTAPTSEQLRAVFNANGDIEDAQMRIEERSQMIARLISSEFTEQVDVLYEQQPTILAQKIHNKHRELSARSRWIGALATFAVVSIGAGSVISTQDVKPEVSIATGILAGSIGAFTSHLINSTPNSMARAARRSARRKLRHDGFDA